MSEQNERADSQTDRLSAILRRTKDHRVAQWMIGYVALAYGIQHAVTLTSEAFDWPHAITRISMLLLILGAPLATVFAWYHGERTTRRISAGEMTLASLLLVLISLVFYAVVRPAERVAIAAAPAVASTAPVGLSLAVLPFVNLSSDAEQEFFSDGMTEEITSALAKIPKLPVVGRTSAFQFKGQNKDLRAIGQALNAAYVLEGSVRKAGDRVRITAQLIRASDDRHVWTESYDRELKDVFAVQEDVARAIAISLQVPLGIRQGETLVTSRTTDAAAYEDFLRAKALVRSRSRSGFPQLIEAARLLERVVARQPDYAPAWALLALDYVLTPAYDPGYYSGEKERIRSFAGTIPKAEAAAQRAVQLDPKSADGYVALASVYAGHAQLQRADELFRHALALDPGNADALHLYSGMLGDAGYIRKMIPMRERLQALEPLVPVFQLSESRGRFAWGDNNGALAALKLPNIADQYAIIYAAQGRFREAADRLAENGSFLPDKVRAAVNLLRSAPSSISSPKALPRLGYMQFAYLYAGASGRVLDFDEDMLDSGWRHPTLSIVLWAPSYASVRQTDRFKAFVRRAGYVDYWRENGWPDLCHPTTGDDFECS